MQYSGPHFIERNPELQAKGFRIECSLSAVSINWGSFLWLSPQCQPYYLGSIVRLLNLRTSQLSFPDVYVNSNSKTLTGLNRKTQDIPKA